MPRELVAGTEADRASLTQEVYVWQRAWNGPVREAVAQHGARFAGLIPLSAEVVFQREQPQVIRVPLDYATLKAAHCPVGLALRIGPYRDAFASEGAVTTLLTDLAFSMVERAKTNGMEPTELQIDFDCAESKLDGYRIWVEAIRRKVAPVPVVITALPAWLNQKSFARLIQSADGYVLQVHSLEKPKNLKSMTSFSLCDPGAAKRAVERAGRLGKPFRVALPTYGYLLAFAPEGAFVGLSAEGPAKDWPQGAQLREVRSSPVEMAGLVDDWSTNHPAAMTGIIWYRMPISLDSLNWSWPTFFAVLDGRSPRENVRVEVRRPESGLVEISLINEGEADLSSRPVVEIRWQKGRLVAADGLRDFEVVDAGPNTLQLRAKSTITHSRLTPGERQAMGWLRFNEEVEVQIETKKF
ncbi:MAG: hypothetical protein JWR26_513 [Pedosphaera sp.]|nr:hypothetical protein [Pedosphaera sp.]